MKKNAGAHSKGHVLTRLRLSMEFPVPAKRDPALELDRIMSSIAADAHLAAGRMGEAAAALASWGTSHSVADQAIRATIRACEAEAVGRTDDARKLFEAIAGVALPLPGVLLSAGRFLSAHGMSELASSCFARASLCGRATAEQVALQKIDLDAHAPEVLKGRFDAHVPGSLDVLLLLKRSLLSEFSWADALIAYGAMFANHGISRLGELPLCGLRDYARREGDCYTEVFEGGLLSLKMPLVAGQSVAETLSARGRTLFYAALKDVIVTSRSTLLETNNVVLYDFQDDDLEKIPVEFGYDALALEAHRDMVTIVRLGGTPIEIDEAISLVGTSAHAFGHWVSEYLLKFFVLDRARVARGIPILIDAHMPRQHRQALEYFSRGEHPIVELPALSSVRVRKLWACATFVFIPIMPRPGRAIDPRIVCPPAQWVARLLGSVRKPDRPADPGLRRLFLPRRPRSWRKLVNLSDVERVCRKNGFIPVYLEDLSFEEQLWLVGNATHVIGGCWFGPHSGVLLRLNEREGA